jgi:hypothetical protein
MDGAGSPSPRADAPAATADSPRARRSGGGDSPQHAKSSSSLRSGGSATQDGERSPSRSLSRGVGGVRAAAAADAPPPPPIFCASCAGITAAWYCETCCDALCTPCWCAVHARGAAAAHP